MTAEPNETTRLLRSDVEIPENDVGTAWWKIQSPWWALVVAPLLAATAGIVLAPKIEVYTGLACMAHRPELFEDATLLSSAIPTVLPRQCETDPEIRRAVAKLTSAENTILGILSCLTTGWWASFSDRTGRRNLFLVTAFGAMCANTVYLLVNRYWRVMPTGYWSVLLGPLIEGSLGGMPAAVMAFISYVSDTTQERDRSRMLALNFGLYWTGLSLGPLIGNAALKVTGNILSVFYIAIALQAAFLAYTRLIMVEPLSQEQQRQARANWKLAHDDAHSALQGSGLLAKLWSPISPIFRPLEAIKPTWKSSTGSALAQPRRDWNLFLAAVGLGTLYIIAGDIQFKFQYAAAAFGWTAKENGIFLSVSSATRGVYLTIILPFMINLFKPPTREVDIQIESATEPTGYKIIKYKLESPTFDLRLARRSLLLEGMVHVIMLLFPSPASLYVLGVFGTCGAGFPPAMQSVILSLYIHNGGKENGKVFGALGVIQILCAQIISPLLYGLIYVATVTFFPMSIFAVSLTAIMTAFSIACMVRMPSHAESIAKFSGGADSPPPHASAIEAQRESGRI